MGIDFLKCGIEKAPLAIGVCRMDGSIEYLNNAFVKRFGYTIKDIKTITDCAEKVLPEVDKEVGIRMWKKDIEFSIKNNACTPPKQLTIQTKKRELVNAEVSISVEDDIIYVYFNDITLITSTENALKLSRENYKQLFDHMTSGFAFHEIICDKNDKPCDYRFIDINPAFEELTGLKREEVLGRTVLEILPNTEKYWIENYGKVALTGETIFFENYSQELDRYYEVTGYCPKHRYFAVLFNDVTKRNRAELKVKEAEALYSSLVETAEDMIWKCDNEGRFIFLNKACEKVYGYTAEEMLGRPFADFAEEDIAIRDMQIFTKLLSEKESITGYETVHLKKDGSPVFLSYNARYFKDEKENKIGIQGIAQDCTSRILAENALKKVRLFNDNLIDTANVIIVALDKKGEIQIFNPYAENLTGYRKEELIGKNWFEVLVPKRKYPNVWKVFSKLLSQGIPKKFENPVLTKDGKELYIAWSNAELKSENGIDGTISFGIDITEKRKTEIALIESEERYKTLAGASFEGIALSKNGRIVDVNNRLLEIYGYTLGEMKRLKLKDLIYEENVDLMKKNINSNVTSVYEHRGIKSDGSVLFLEVHASNIKFKNEDYRLMVIRDITKRKVYENELVKSEEKFRNIFNSSTDGILVID